MDRIKLSEIVGKHAEWVINPYEGERANLSRAYLPRADLSGAYLSRADLSGANLSGANLSGANLSRAYLSGADLYGANLSRADLSGASLFEADLSRANLYGADLSEANLSGADLSGANLSRANLSGADLSEANLSGTDLSGHTIVPDVGAFTAFKQILGGLIVELYIPRSAGRVGGLTGRKCRVSKAKVKSIVTPSGEPVLSGCSIYNHNFLYEVGEWVVPVQPFDDDVRTQCASGIHCFITKKEAIDYV